MTIDFDRRLRAADPASGLPGLSDERVAAMLRRILAATDTDAGTDTDTDRASVVSAAAVVTGGRRNRRVALGAVGLLAATAVATAVFVLGPVMGPSQDGAISGGASAAAAQLLGRAAELSPVDPPAKPSRYWRVTTTGTTLSTTAEGDPGAPVTASYLVSSTRTEYVAVDGTRPTWFVEGPRKRVRQLSGPSGVGAPEGDGTTFIWTSNLTPAKVPGSWQAPNLTWLRGLPRDPAELRARLYADAAGHGQSTDGEVLVLVADVMRSGLVPGDLRAALFRVLATVPGMEVTADSAAVDGRTGVAIGRNETAGVDRQELILDPATGQVIGERTVATKEFGGITAGTVIGDTAVTRTLVDAVPSEVRAKAVHQSCVVQTDGAVACTEQGRGGK